MAKFNASTITIKDMEFAFPPDFTGTVDDYNPNGYKTFDVKLPDKETYLTLLEDGWNVKQWPKNPDPDQDPIYYLNVKVNYLGPNNKLNPVIWLINANDTSKKRLMTDETVHQIDGYFADDCITEMIVTIRPREYPPTPLKPEGGIKAYCKKLVIFYKPDDIDALLESLGGDGGETDFDMPF